MLDIEKIKKAEQVLIDNGIEPDEAEIVLQTIGYVLLDEELYPDTVEFVSYDGKFPCLCCGTLVLRINGENVVFPKYSLVSGGKCVDYNGDVKKGAWTVNNIPDNYLYLKKEIEDCVNVNVKKGCCGGCN